MPQHLHNEDAVGFMSHALEWLQEQADAGRQPKCAMTLLWKDPRGESHVLPALLSARPSTDALALTARLQELYQGQPMGDDETISLLLTSAYYTQRLRTGFTLARRHGESTLLITEHLRSTNRTLPKPRVLERTPTVTASEITYDDGPFTRMPNAVMALFQAFASEMPDMVDMKGSPFRRHAVANPAAAGRLVF